MDHQAIKDKIKNPEQCCLFAMMPIESDHEQMVLPRYQNDNNSKNNNTNYLP